MFRSVEYAGFDGRPDLRSVAELATALLADEADRQADDLSVRWVFDPARPDAVELALRLDLPAGTGSGTRPIPITAFPDEPELRSQLRRTALAATSSYLDKRRAAWAELGRQPAGV